jgi:Rieske Fe-S protein
MSAEVKGPDGNAIASRDGCDDCPIARRDFLRAGAILAALTVAAATTPGAAAALPVRFAAALGRSGKDVRFAVPTADGATIDKNNDVIIARVGGSIFALDLTCPHQNTAIRWSARENRFECPKHHSMYSPEGLFIEGRATRSLDRFPIRLDGNQVIVDVETTYRQDLDRPLWEAAVVKA